MSKLGQKFRIGSKQIQYRAAKDDVLEAIAAILPVVTADDSSEAVHFSTVQNPAGELAKDASSSIQAEVFASSLPDAECLTIEAEIADLEQAIIAISDVLMAKYQNRGNLWIDAAVLISPEGKRVLLCGASEAGKSTLTAAFAALGWKLSTEDVAIICRDGKIPPLVRPISLRDGTAQRIKEQTGYELKVFDDRWLFEESYFCEQELSMPLDVVVLIKGVIPDAPETMDVENVSAELMTRELLPCSNALRIEDGVELLHGALSPSPCYILNGGTISERLAKVASLAQEVQKK